MLMADDMPGLVQARLNGSLRNIQPRCDLLHGVAEDRMEDQPLKLIRGQSLMACSYRELAARWPDAHRHELEESLRVLARLELGEDPSDTSPREPKT